MRDSSDTVRSLALFLDLGDILTKGLCASGAGTKHFGFLSVVAHRLLTSKPDATDLLFDGHDRLPRMTDFDPATHPRTASYPGAEDFLSHADPVEDARFAGWIAAAYGADRQLLGNHPTQDNVDALVRKALMRTAGSERRADVTFVIDLGAKARAIERYAETTPRQVGFMARSFVEAKPRRIELDLRCRIYDAVDCATAALPPDISVDRVGRVLLVDIGYLRTKLAIISRDGCELQEQVLGLGVANCVLRILRDGQDQGLVEDEVAVIRALERSHTTLEVAGRSFSIGNILAASRRDLGEEVAQAARRALVQHIGRGGEMCRSAAIIGGGAAIAGEDVARRLETLELGLGTIWVANDTRFLLVEGARRLAQTS